MSDVLAKLRNWVTDWNGLGMVRGEPPRDGLHCDDIYDAIDEIMRLRKRLDIARAHVIPNECAEARAEALEEAARVADGYCTDRTDDVARAIRALKDK